MSDCPACFLLLYSLGSGWVHLCVLLTLSNVLTAPYQDLSTSIWGSCDIPINMCVSNTTACFQHLLEDADPPSANEPWVVMEPGLQCTLELCPPFCSGRESSGQRAPRPCQLLLLHHSSHPSKVCTWGTTLARLLRPLPLCRPVPICGLLSCEQPAHWIFGWYLQATWPRAETPMPSSYTSPEWCWQWQGLFRCKWFYILHWIRSTSYWCWQGEQQYQSRNHSQEFCFLILRELAGSWAEENI